MPTTRILSITLLSLLPALAPAFEWTDECDQNQLSMNTCAAQELQFHDQRLNALYQQQMQYLEDPLTRERLRNAQRAWIAFRDADCRYQVGEREDSGSIWPLLQNNCLTERTRKRVEELESYVACREDGCPR